MLKKTTLAALLAAGTMSVAAVAFAATETQAPAAPAPAEAVAAPEAAQSVNPSVAMSAAVATAEKTYEAKSFRANLRQTAEYGLVWDVRLVRDDGTRVRAYVDARTGNAVAANEIGIRRNAPRAMPNPQCPFGGPGMGPGMGMGPNPDCPLTGNGPRHHRGYGFHRNW